MQTSESIKNNRFYVYEHRRADTGNPFYVGKGSGNRIDAVYNRNDYWKRIAKEGYTKHIYKDNLTEKEALALEVGLILMGKVSGCCEANLTRGGDAVRLYGPRWWGDKISAAMKGKVGLKGPESHSYKSVSVEDITRLYTVEKLSSTEISKQVGVSITTVIERLRLNGVHVRKSGRATVAIQCTNDGNTLTSINDAARHYGLHRENIRKVLKGQYKTTGGLTFKYL